ncbi:cupin domain-containing protein [Mucilaginibacter psychrotolerans]|uniref:Cupin domain-containing protein n=1 Tax=Mucilaginibacter psychrotolerans TaxID=1524096 RepID=A0A4Y8SPX4_9SPHI|nr:cupin domain-containing protein [Mucilaginibacter psychrotolerans]TFF40637.1 cupin domain-containing protein [Mucilaginibacter psychrotolerans]
MKSNSTISRRTLVQNLALATVGIGLSQLASGKENEHKVMKPLLPFYVPPQKPLQPGPGGIDIRTLVRSSKTNLQFSCVETAVAARTMGPAPHLHKNLDELMLVLEGTATVMVDGKVEEIEAGGWHFRPRKLEHTFWNNSEKPLRFIDMYFNQNFEDFLEELFHQIFPDMMKNQLTPKDPQIAQRLKSLDKRFGVTTFPEKRQPIIDKYGLKG